MAIQIFSLVVLLTIAITLAGAAIALAMWPGKTGDVLFTIDPVKYQAIVDRLQADLDLAKIRLSQSTELLKRGSGRQIDVDRDSKQVASLNAQLDAAR